jgi:hypothetical protein
MQPVENKVVSTWWFGCFVSLYAFRSLSVIRVGVCLAFFQCSIVDLRLLYIILKYFAPCVGVFSSLLHYHCYTV